MSNNSNPYDIDSRQVRDKGYTNYVERATVLDVLPEIHSVRVNIRNNNAPIVAPVLTATYGSQTLPKEGERVTLLYITDNTPIVLGSIYLLDGQNPPNADPNDIVIGNDAGYIAIREDGTVETSGSFSSYSDEDAQDATASMVTGGSNITTTYDDANNTLTIDGFSGDHTDLTNVQSDQHHTKTSSASELTDVSPDSNADAHHTRYTDEEAQDASASMITGGTNVTTTYDDGANTFTIDASTNLQAKIFLAEGSNTNINQTTTVSWNSTTFNDSVFTWDGSSQLTIDKAGRYEIHAEADFGSSGDSRQNPNLFVHQNGNIVGVGGRSGYMRDSEGHDQSSVHSHAVINANSGDVIDVESRAEADTSGSVTPARAMFYVIRLEKNTSSTPTLGYFDGNLTSTQTNAESGTYVNVADSVNQNDGWTVDSSSQISPDESGTYKVEFNVNFHRTGSGARNIMYAELELNGTRLDERTRGVCYIRNDGNGDEGDADGSAILDLNAGDDLRVYAAEERGGETGNDIERASINITKL